MDAFVLSVLFRLSHLQLPSSASDFLFPFYLYHRYKSFSSCFHNRCRSTSAAATASFDPKLLPIYFSPCFHHCLQSGSASTSEFYCVFRCFHKSVNQFVARLVGRPRFRKYNECSRGSQAEHHQAAMSSYNIARGCIVDLMGLFSRSQATL